MTTLIHRLAELPMVVRGPLELAIALTVCLGAAWWVERSWAKRSAAFRAHVWLIGFVAALAWTVVRLGGVTIPVPLPVAESRPTVRVTPPDRGPWTRPASREQEVAAASENRIPAAAERAANSTGEKEEKTVMLDGPGLIGAIWLIGVVVVLCRILAGALMLQRSLRLTRPPSPRSVLAQVIAELKPPETGRLRVRFHPAVSSPVSFGIRTWSIFFPPEAEHWSATQVRLVLAHELAHCVRRDHLSILFIRLVAALAWFHPLVWFGVRRFRLLCESAADDRAVEQVEVSVYARELLDLIRGLRQGQAFLSAATLSIGAPSTIKDRIAALLDSTKDRRRLSTRASIVMAVVAVVAAGLLPGLRPVRAEKGAPATTNSVPAKAKSTVSLRSETRELKISVRDEQGNPVPDAVIEPKGCRTDVDRGSWYSWSSEVPNNPVKTDETGVATLRIPAFAHEDLPTSAITATVTHADFCLLLGEVSVLHPEHLTLQRGATISVNMIPPSGASPEMIVCADLFAEEGRYKWVEWRRRERSGGVVAQLEPGSYAIRAVAFGNDGRKFFSPVTALKVSRGETRELVLPVSPGFGVRGKLSANVPTPVTNGRVVARLASMVAGEEQAFWSAWTPIRADGTFELASVPKGEIQIIAICDGYVSRNPASSAQEIHNTTVAQIFDFSLADDLEVAMEKTGEAKVRVLTSDGKPLPGAQVAFWPNQRSTAGSSILGQGFDQEAFLKWAQIDNRRGSQPKPSAPSWITTTDEAGVAAMPNLPGTTHTYVVSAEAWEMPVMTTEYGQPRREGQIGIKAGEVTTAAVKMEPKGKTSLNAQAVKETLKRGSAGTDRSIPRSRLTGDPFPVALGKDLVGRVVDESGAPLAGVLVDAWTWCAGNETKTDQDGRFRLPEPGDQDNRNIEVRFSLAGFSPFHVTRQPVGILSNDVVLSKRPYFEGIVRGSKGQPIAGQLVRATCGEKEGDGVSISSIWSETRTDAEGRYRLHVFPDTFRVEVRSKTGEVARLLDEAIARDETRPLDIALTPGLTFRALVVDAASGQPVPGVRLKHWEHPGIEGVSDEKGNLAIAGMFPGDFEFEVDAEKLGYRRWWSSEAKNEWERRSIEKSGWQRNFDNLQFSIYPDFQPARIEMEKGVKIRGVVRAPDGSVVKGATVAPAHTGTGNSLTGDTRFSVPSKDDGSFEMLLPAGNGVPYNLVVHDGAYGVWRNFANGVLPPIKTTPGEVIAGIEIALTTPCTVQGRVVDTAGQPVAGREVRAASSDRWENRYYFPTTRTKPDGTFELRHVRPGKQLIQVAPFWLNPTESPGPASVEVEATPTQTTSGITLTTSAAP